MTTHLPKVAAATMRWLAGGGDDEGEEHGFGVHIEYEDLYDTILFFIAIYASGQIATFVKMPSLVGEIVCGILLGPPLADFVPNPEAFVLLGEIGYVLLFILCGIGYFLLGDSTYLYIASFAPLWDVISDLSCWWSKPVLILMFQR